MAIPVFKPSIKRKSMDAVLTCLVSEKIGTGGICREFTDLLSQYLGSAGGLVFREHRRALSTALESLSLEEGSGVIISPLSPAVYIDALQENQLIPLYADVDPDSGCMDPAAAEKLMEHKPGAVLVDYPLGFVPDMETISGLEIPVIEDVSKGLGGNTGVKKAGSYSRYVIISLEEDCIITAGGGTAVLAASKNDLTELRKNSGPLSSASLLPDMNAALGLSQISELEKFIARRKETAEIYAGSLMKTRHKTIIQRGEGENVFYSFPVFLKSGMNEAMRYAKKKGVGTRAAFPDTAFEVSPSDHFPCPNAQALRMRSVIFPLYPMLTKKEITLISRVLATLP